jgi:hypothetical protein
VGRPAGWMVTRTGRPAMPSPGRPPIHRDLERAFWMKIAQGMTSEDAAVACGVSGPVGSRWFRERGGMPSLTLTPRSGRYLSFGAELLAAAQTVHAQVPHQSVHRAVGDDQTPAAQVRGHLPATVEPLGDAAGREQGVDDDRVGHGLGRDRSVGLSPGSVGPRRDRAAVLGEHPAGRLDGVTLRFHVFDERHDQRLRGSSSPMLLCQAASRSGAQVLAFCPALVGAGGRLVGFGIEGTGSYGVGLARFLPPPRSRRARDRPSRPCRRAAAGRQKRHNRRRARGLAAAGRPRPVDTA